MEKKALSSIPRPVVTEQNKEMLLLIPSLSYLVTSQRMLVNGTDTLIMNFFHPENKELKPAFRTFCQPEDYITQDLTTDKTKWKSGAINYLTGYLYWHRQSGNIVMASVEDRKTIMQFLGEFKKKHDLKDKERSETVVDKEVEDCIDEYQDKIKEWKLQKKHQVEKDEIDRQMAEFGDLPRDYDSFVDKKVFKDAHYIFYSSKKKIAYCTKCEKEFELTKDKYLKHKTIAVWNNRDKVKHNSSVHCPYCHQLSKCKSEGVSRQSLLSIQWSVLVQKSGEKVLVRYLCHTKDFRSDYRKPEIKTYEKYRTVHTAEKSSDYEWGDFKNTGEIRWRKYKDRHLGWNQPSEFEMPKSVVLYNENLAEVVAGTCMKYSAVDIYVDKIIGSEYFVNQPWSIDWYFNNYRKKPYLEQMLKIGFYKLVEEALGSYNVPKFKPGRSILDTLEITKTQFNMLREVGNPNYRDIQILKYGKNLNQKEFEILRKVRQGVTNRYEKLIDMKKYTTIYKLDKYLVKNKVDESDYFDYIRWLEKLGYDMRNEFNLYPKDFQKAHDEKSAEYMKLKDKEAMEEAKKFDKLLKKMRKQISKDEAMNLKIQGLFIRLPYKVDEIKKEGEILHHCVGTYVERVMKGETQIFFIRKEEEPDKPYYTLEWKGDQISQCRGYKNCDMTPEVKAFTQIFKEKMLEDSKKEQKKMKLKTAS